MAGRAPRGRAAAPRRGSAAPRFAIVAARFNERITKRLVDGAAGAFASHGVPASRVDVYWVPGTFGVVTALSEEQAWDRAGGEAGNRGEEAAEAAVEMAEFVARVAERGQTP